MEFVLIGLVISGFIGAALGSSKNMAGTGCLAGLLLGPIGWILMALTAGKNAPPQVVVNTATPPPQAYPTVPPHFVPCVACRTPIDPLASVCARCLREQTPRT